MSLDSDVYVASCLITGEPIKNLSRYYRNFYHIYPFTTENLSGYFSELNLKDKTILTTGSSADQILNAISMDCKSVTCFDINPFVKYFYELKVAAIQNLRYSEFNKFFYVSRLSDNKTRICLCDGFGIDIYSKLSSFLEGDTKKFWDSLFSKFSSKEIKSGLFFPIKLSPKKIRDVNDYLDENKYYKLRYKLNDVDVEFIRCNIRNLPRMLTKKYDYIILSNLLQYMNSLRETNGLRILKNLLLSLEDKLKEDGQIEVCYLYNYSDNIKDTDKYQQHCEETKQFLGDSKVYYLQLPSVSRQVPFSLKKDCVLMYKKEPVKVYKKTSL